MPVVPFQSMTNFFNAPWQTYILLLQAFIKKKYIDFNQDPLPAEYRIVFAKLTASLSFVPQNR